MIKCIKTLIKRRENINQKYKGIRTVIRVKLQSFGKLSPSPISEESLPIFSFVQKMRININVFQLKMCY